MALTDLQKAVAAGALRTGGAAGAASSSGTQRTATQDNASVLRRQYAQEQQKNRLEKPLTETQKRLVRGLVQQHPEALNNVYNNLNNSYTAAYNGLRSGNIRTPEQLAGVKSVLDAAQSHLVSLKMLKEALGQDSPQRIGLDIETVQGGVDDLMRDYERLSATLPTMPGAAKTIAMDRQGIFNNPLLNEKTMGRSYGRGAASGIDIAGAQAVERARQTQAAYDALPWYEKTQQVRPVDNTEYWQKRIDSAQRIIDNYNAGGEATTKHDYDQAVQLQEKFKKNQRDNAPTTGQRLENMGKTVWNQVAGSAAQTLATGLEATVGTNAEASRRMEEENLASARTRKQSYLEDVAAGRAVYAQITVDQMDAEIRRHQENIEHWNQVTDSNQDWVNAFNINADDFYAASETQTAQAKLNATPIGEFMVDVGIAGGQMLLDIAAGGGNAIIPMMVRSFGSGAYEARQNGGDIDEQVYNGVKSAVVEWATEKLFAGNPVYDADHGVLTDWVWKTLNSRYGAEAVEAFMQTTKGRILKAAGGMTFEGLEEAISDWANPAVDSIRNALKGEGWNYDAPQIGEVARDAAVGALLGGMGQGVELASESVANRIRRPGRSSYIDSDAEVEHSVSEQRRVDDFKDAVDRKIVSFVEKVRGLKNPSYRSKIKHTISNVTEDQAGVVRGLTGVDVTGFRNIIDGDAVDHIDRRHGANGEADSSMADINDIGRIGYVLENFDEAELLTNRDGTPRTSRKWRSSDGSAAPMIRFNKKIDGTMYVVEAAPDSAAKNLAVVTAYMQKNSDGNVAVPVPHAGNQPAADVRNEEGASASIGDNIAQENEPVNVPERVDRELLTRELNAVRRLANQESDMDVMVSLSHKYDEVKQAANRALDAQNVAEAEAYTRVLETLTRAVESAENRATVPERAAALRETINNELGGADNGRTDLSDGAGRQDAGAGAGVEAGTVRPAQYGADGRRPGNRAADYRRYETTERRSAAEFGIDGGTEDQVNGVIAEHTWTDGMKEAARRAAERGYKTTYVTGLLRVVNPVSGEVQGMKGYINGDQVIVQADNLRNTPEQIMDHELMHDRINGDRALVTEISDRLLDVMTERELEEVIARYVNGYKGIYGVYNESMSSDEQAALREMYLTEFICDAAAGIDRDYAGRFRASQYTDVVNEVIREREGMGNGSGGMPGVRYAIKDLEDGRSYVRADRQVFYGNDPEAWGEQVTNYINDKIRHGEDVELEAADGDILLITKTTAGKAAFWNYVRTEKGGYRRLSEAEYEAKLNAEAHIDELAQTSRRDDKGRNKPDELGVHGDLAKDGWRYRKAYFEDFDGKYYEVTLSTPVNGNRVEVYNVGQMRERRSPIGNLGSSADNSSARDRTSSKFSISDLSENSNTEIGLRSNIPGLTRWDREAEARAEREAQAERAPVLRESEESVNRGRFSVAEEDVGEIGEIDPAEERRALMEKAVEDMTRTELRKAVAEDKGKLNFLEEYEKEGQLTGKMRADLAEIRERLSREREVLRERDQKAREERKAALERQKARTTPTIARRQFIKQVMDRFSTPMGERTAMGNMLGSLFDDAFSRGSINNRDMDAVFDTLLDRGFVTVDADPYYQDMRSNIAGTRIFVPEDIRENFGDDYKALRKRAYAAGVILTRDANDMQIDSLHTELSGEYPGAFRADETDLGTMLDNLIDIAEQGKAERITLAEMLGRVQNDTGWSVDEQIEHMHEQFVQDIEKAMHAAGIEVQQKATNALQMAREREARQESVRRQAARRQLSEMRQKDLNLLQWMNRNKHRATTPEMRAAIDEMLERINYLSIQMADETRYLDKYGATVGDVVKMYEAGKKNNPNWTPSKEIEALVHRTHSLALGEMSIETLDELYHNLLEIQTEIFNAKHMIDDEQHALVQDYYDESTGEIKNSDGKGKLSVMDTALTPINQIMKLGGWNEGGAMHRVGKMLQDGERTAKNYEVGARRMLRDFTLQNAKWLTTADGRGRKGVWLKYDITPLVKTDFAGNSTYEDETVTVWLTPLQRVHLYLESKNYQNLNHMQEGGRTFANKELYAKGKRSEAFQQGTTVKLSKEWVDTICRDMTAEEIELARILEKYYNEYAPEQINPVSRKLVGYDKAVIDNYAPIQTNSSYNASQPGLYDLTAAGVGVMKDRQAVANNPSLNVGAIDAFERHLRQTSKYVGLAIPVSNVTRLMNWQDKENNTSFKDILAHKWGGEAVDRLNGFLTDIQNPKRGPDSKLGQLLNKGVSNYIGATFAFNIGIAAKQFASFPAAAAVLDGKLPSFRQLRSIDEELILKYTPELAYRQLGQGTPEIAKMRENPNILDRNKITQRWLRGGLIQDVDVFTVRTMWAWAENTVDKHNTGEDRVEKGSDEYYRRVADVYNEAVNLTQPMYDFMNRAQIMNSKDAITRTLTMFKTVPLQEFNTMARYIGEAKNGGKEAKRKAARAVGTVIASTLMLETIELANDWIKNGLKGYKDDDDELTAKSLAKNFGLNMISVLMGIFPGGSQLFEILLHKNGASGSNGFTLVGSDQINELIEVIQNGGDGLWKTMTGIWDVIDNGGDAGEYLRRHGGDIAGGVHDLAVALAKYGGGLPVENVEKYLGGILAKAWPEGKAYLQALTDTTTKKDLDYMAGPEMPARLNTLLAIRNIDADDGTTEELARLYQAGYKSAVPADTPDSITVNSEERELTPYEMQTYDNAYSAAIGESLDALVESEAYIRSDDQGRAKMLGRLYEYTNQTAAREVTPDYEGDGWTRKAAEAAENGLPLEAYIALQGAGLGKTADKLDFIDDMKLTDEQKGVLYYYGVASEERMEDLDNLRDAGMDWGTAYETVKQYMEIDAEDMSASQKAAEFATWAADNLDVKETAAARENLTFSSTMRANTDTYDKLVAAGVSNDTALKIYSGWGALEPEGDATQVSDRQRISLVAEMDVSDQEKAKTFGTMDSAMWRRLNEAGASQSAAVKAMGAVAKLRPEPGEESVSTLQKVNAIMNAVSGNEDQVKTLQAVLSSAAQAHRLKAMSEDWGITAKIYSEFLNKMPDYMAMTTDGSATYLDGKECKALLDSMDITMNDRAVLWQNQMTSSSWKSNPYITSVGQAIYDEYQAWSAEQKEEAEKEEIKETESAKTKDNTNPSGWVLPTLNIP